MQIELTSATYESFLKLKKTIEDMVGEEVTDDQVMDFMIRNLMNALDVSSQEHDGGCCCGHQHCHD